MNSQHRRRSSMQTARSYNRAARMIEMMEEVAGSAC
jgi:hypothetical protein